MATLCPKVKGGGLLDELVELSILTSVLAAGVKVVRGNRFEVGSVGGLGRTLCDANGKTAGGAIVTTVSACSLVAGAVRPVVFVAPGAL